MKRYVLLYEIKATRTAFVEAETPEDALNAALNQAANVPDYNGPHHRLEAIAVIDREEAATLIYHKLP